MPAMVIEQAEVRLTVEQLLDALKQLAPEEQERVRQALEPAPWEARLDALLKQVREGKGQYRISESEIEAEVEAIRAERHDQSSS